MQVRGLVRASVSLEGRLYVTNDSGVVDYAPFRNCRSGPADASAALQVVQGLYRTRLPIRRLQLSSCLHRIEAIKGIFCTKIARSS